ncbi:MAG: CRISPR-associated endonuclease Cas1 [Sandaracinaceae bacterium]
MSERASVRPIEAEPRPDGELPRPKALRRSLPLAPDAPELVPARMVNEVLYCERLLYLEWAQGEFEDNVFTADGRVVHRRVDQARGQLPDPDADDDEAPPPWQARSVWLSSERLGLTAKLDVVEGEGGVVVPVEHKRGKSPGLTEGAYLPERAQVCAHVLLLRDHGYHVPHGEIWFAGDRRRVTIAIDDRLVATTLRAIERAKEVVRQAVIPPPLEGDPRCKGCSLVGICLPDEVTLLRGLEGKPLDPPRTEAQLALDFGSDAWGPIRPDPWQLAGDPPDVHPELRRLHPARDEGTVLYVTTNGARLAVDGDVLRVEGTGNGPVHARLPQTSHVCLFGNVQVTTQALAALLERDIPIFFFSSGGWLRGRTTGHGTKNIELRLAQFRGADDPALALELAGTFVAAKIRNQRTMLRRNAPGTDVVVLNELELLARKSERAESVESLLGLEGTAARSYFGAFGGMLKSAASDFDLNGRNRRPPKDPVNALLSLAYSLLTKDVVVACLAAGLDPLLGFLHRPRYGRPALALDLMEEMRPLVGDSCVVNALNTGVVGPDDFVRTPGACALTPAARKRFIEAYERRVDQLVTHPVFGYRISYRRVFEVQARLLGRRLLGEIEQYPAFRTR